MIVKSVALRAPFRDFPEGFSVNFPSRVTVIVGDNGAGKSSLLGLIRGQFNSAWTPSSLADCKEVEIFPTPNPDEPVSYIDLAADHMAFRGDLDESNLQTHIKTLRKSAGQASIIQLADIMEKSKAALHIVDEPERGLSPGKQWVLVALLKEFVAERPNEQFIISTHNEMVMKAFGGQVLQLPDGVYLDPEDYLDASNRFGQAQSARYIKARQEEKVRGVRL